ncbi:DJ-1/PfpI family protein [Pollutimonas bauzanensis]|uniref:DJ-1/PfpI family protein n=1 Tax=Pollutimonas bauzanensis TaxID=658167 RepID=UPI00333EF70D
MRKKWIFITLGCVVALSLLVAPIVLAPGAEPSDMRSVIAIDQAEQAKAIEAMRPPKRARPVIAIVALNDATEVSDFLVAYGVLRQADVADVTVVAERAEPVQLYPPSLRIEPETTVRAFDERYPDGADYIVVPAMEPSNNSFVMDWIVAQFRKGAKIISICNGSRTLAAAGLLDGRRATGHWYTIPQLKKAHPSLQQVRDRRYVTDNGITTSTGVSANIPLMVALVEAIGGRETAERVAGELGVKTWDSRHRSGDFQLTLERKKTFVRNTLTFWRHETVGIPVVENVDEVALGVMADAYSRTAMTTVVTLGNHGKAVRSRHGLVIHPDQSVQAAAVDEMLPAPSSDAPAMTMERELARISSRYDPPTAAIVALTMEYPWASGYASTGSR